MVITSTQFRANQSKYIGMAHQGKEIVVASRAGRVMLTPINNNVITPELQAEIDDARRQMREGKCITFKTHEDIDNYFNSL